MSGILRISHDLITIDQTDVTIDAKEAAVNLTDIKYDMAILGYCRNFVVGDYRQDTVDEHDFRSNVKFALKQDYILNPHLVGDPGVMAGADPTLVGISTQGRQISWNQASGTFTTVGDHGLLVGDVITMRDFSGTAVGVGKGADYINNINVTVLANGFTATSFTVMITATGLTVKGDAAGSPEELTTIDESITGNSATTSFADLSPESFQVSEEDFFFIVPQTHLSVMGNTIPGAKIPDGADESTNTERNISEYNKLITYTSHGAYSLLGDNYDTGKVKLFARNISVPSKMNSDGTQNTDDWISDEKFVSIDSGSGAGFSNLKERAIGGDGNNYITANAPSPFYGDADANSLGASSVNKLIFSLETTATKPVLIPAYDMHAGNSDASNLLVDGTAVGTATEIASRVNQLGLSSAPNMQMFIGPNKTSLFDGLVSAVQAAVNKRVNRGDYIQNEKILKKYLAQQFKDAWTLSEVEATKDGVNLATDSLAEGVISTGVSSMFPNYRNEAIRINELNGSLLNPDYRAPYAGQLNQPAGDPVPVTALTNLTLVPGFPTKLTVDTPLVSEKGIAKDDNIIITGYQDNAYPLNNPLINGLVFNVNDVVSAGGMDTITITLDTRTEWDPSGAAMTGVAINIMPKNYEREKYQRQSYNFDKMETYMNIVINGRIIDPVLADGIDLTKEENVINIYGKWWLLETKIRAAVDGPEGKDNSGGTPLQNGVISEFSAPATNSANGLLYTDGNPKDTVITAYDTNGVIITDSANNVQRSDITGLAGSNPVNSTAYNTVAKTYATGAGDSSGTADGQSPPTFRVSVLVCIRNNWFY